MRKRPSIWPWFVAVAFLKVPFSRLRRSLALAERHGLEIAFDMLVSHHMAGGRILSWVEGLVYARDNGVALEVMNGAARDLLGTQGSGISLTEHIQLAQRAGITDMRSMPFDTLQKRTPDRVAGSD
jgi:uncharacterized protein YqfA (UPF0365 family)